MNYGNISTNYIRLDHRGNRWFIDTVVYSYKSSILLVIN